MIIAVASGKGGTGKTTVATSLALSLAPLMPVTFLDCDVEAPNAHLFLKPQIEKRMPATLPVPLVDEAVCQHCGKCAEVCQFHAITAVGATILVFPDLCHGCGSCALSCPEGAIREVPRSLGMLESGRGTDGIQFAQGVLDIGQSLAVPVIRQLRGQFKNNPAELTIIDAPPGTSCPVVESIRGADYVVLVTEPTPFGLHDLKLAYQLTQDLGLPAGVVINRDGIGDMGVSAFCATHDLAVLLRIPLDAELAGALASGIPLVDCVPRYRLQFQRLLAMTVRAQKEPV